MPEMVVPLPIHPSVHPPSQPFTKPVLCKTLWKNDKLRSLLLPPMLLAHASLRTLAGSSGCLLHQSVCMKPAFPLQPALVHKPSTILFILWSPSLPLKYRHDASLIPFTSFHDISWAAGSLTCFRLCSSTDGYTVLD